MPLPDQRATHRERVQRYRDLVDAGDELAAARDKLGWAKGLVKRAARDAIEAGLPIGEVASVAGVSRNTLYRWGCHRAAS